VWNRDLDTASLPEIRDLECRMTLFADEVVYRVPGGPVSVGGR
jgi:hypothetical protein